MIRTFTALLAAAALCLASVAPGQVAPASVAAPGTTSKICGAPDGAATIVPYAKACPAGSVEQLWNGGLFWPSL
jgi:hypothetical protein